MIEFATKAFVTFFVLIDPIGLIPLFLGLVGVRSYQEQKKIALRSTLVAGLLVLGFALLGGAVLRCLGISLEALKVAGGLLLFKIALDMINAQLERETDEEQAESRLRTDVSVFPLAIPLIAGPGTLASVLILTGTAPGGSGASWWCWPWRLWSCSSPTGRSGLRSGSPTCWGAPASMLSPVFWGSCWRP